LHRGLGGGALERVPINTVSDRPHSWRDGRRGALARISTTTSRASAKSWAAFREGSFGRRIASIGDYIRSSS